MLSNEVIDLQRNIQKELDSKYLQKAFNLLKKLTSELQEWLIDEKLAELETSYKYMIQYMLDGVNDPKRVQIYNHLIAETYTLTDTVCEKLLTRDSISLYYGKKRYINNYSRSINQAFTSLDNSINELSLSTLIPNEKVITAKRKIVERELQDFFDRIWCNFPAQSEDLAVLREALQPHRLPEPIAALIVSAITLNVAHNFNDDKIEILINTYNHHDSEEVQIRALCGLLVAILQYNRHIPLYESLNYQIESLFENNRFISDTRNILLQFVRTRDTEKIARKMTEEVIPQMMKISPKLYKKIKEDDALNDLEALEHNPEWQDIIDQSGITDKLMELNDLQHEGADVFMSTFSHLKGFSFFNEIANWFMPFMSQHSEIAAILGNNNGSMNFGEQLQGSGFLCDSDKYSFCLSLAQVPESQRQMMMSQFKSDNMGLKEMESSELSMQSRKRENISNRYIQDLYRFNKLFPRRKEFHDFFSISIEKLMQITSLAPIVQEKKMMKTLGEYFFKNQYYNDAAYIFIRLAQDNLSDCELYQKIGFCFQSKSEYDEALEYYLKADIIKPNDRWTLRHIAICYRNLKKTEMALDYFLRAERLEPDDLSVNLNIGHCYLELKQYDEALKYYFKVDFLDVKGTKARRPIAWCSFLAGKTQQAQQYYDKILNDNPTALDYMNAAHVAWATKEIRKAISLYSESIKAEGNNVAKFSKNFEQDIPELIEAGISPDDIPIVYDQVIYLSQES